MTTAKEHLEEILPRVRESKEKIVREDPKDPDAPTIIEIHRDGESVCTMMCNPDRDLMLFLLKFGIIGMDADRVMYSMETCMTTHTVNPGTGKPWGPNEMTNVLRSKPEFWFEGLVEEAIMTSVWDRSGDMAAAIQKFTLDGEKVTWGEETHNDAKNKTGLVGAVPEAISLMWQDTTMNEDALAAERGERPDLPLMSQQLKDELANMPEVERRARMDLVVLSFMKHQVMMAGQQVMIAMTASRDPEDERTKILLDRATEVGLDLKDKPTS